jgi:hypothetical protein
MFTGQVFSLAEVFGQIVQLQLEIPQGLENAPDAVVHFLDMGPVDIALRPLEVLGPGMAWFMDMSMGDITKERP